MSETPAEAVIREAGKAARVGLLPAELIELFGEPIHVYTRAQAIADGTLVAVDAAVAREAGFTVPVAITSAAWAEAVAWPAEAEQRRRGGTGQSESGRLWDVLHLGRIAAARSDGLRRTGYTVLRVPTEGTGYKPRPVSLALAISGGDNGEPVITVMLANED